jgi:hypothetical protein
MRPMVRRWRVSPIPAGAASGHTPCVRQTTSHHRPPAQTAGSSPDRGEASPERSETDNRALTYLVAFFVVSTVLAAVFLAGLAMLIASAGSATR